MTLYPVAVCFINLRVLIYLLSKSVHPVNQNPASGVPFTFQANFIHCLQYPTNLSRLLGRADVAYFMIMVIRTRFSYGCLLVCVYAKNIIRLRRATYTSQPPSTSYKKAYGVTYKNLSYFTVGYWQTNFKQWFKQCFQVWVLISK